MKLGSSCPNCGSSRREDSDQCPSCGWKTEDRPFPLITENLDEPAANQPSGLKHFPKLAPRERQKPAADAFSLPPARGVTSPSQSYNILVVEDDEGYQELARTLLNEYVVTLCASAEEARAALEKRVSFDLIFLDINLSGASGLEWIYQLNSRGVTDAIPVIICSGRTDPATRATAMERGAAGFLAKPYDGAAMQRLVKVLLPPKKPGIEPRT
ncbi:MAG: response regulator [Elusimicrobiota bacterium]